LTIETEKLNFKKGKVDYVFKIKIMLLPILFVLGFIPATIFGQGK